jgi:hypothetical protein
MPSRYPVIVKTRAAALTPNLGDYAALRESFTWERARSELDGLPGGALNMAYEAVDRHVAKVTATTWRSGGSARTARCEI